MSSRPHEHGGDLWQRFVGAEIEFHHARWEMLQAKQALLASDVNMSEVLAKALSYSPEWGPAFDVLPDTDDAVRRHVFPLLMDVSSNANGFVQRAREIILSLDRQWVLEHIPAEVDRLLGAEATYDEYRRLAELLSALKSPYLKQVVEQAAKSADLDIREVAEEYGGP